MLSEVLKIIPKLDSKDLNKMQATLQSRFTKIAKGFGSGLKKTLMGGGIAGIAIGLIDKLLNPLKEVQDAIDRTLNKSDNLATYANQFNTTAGKLARLQAFAGATGVDEQGLYVLLQKFQQSVAEANADPNKPSAVRNFADRTDTADAFFEFIQSLQKLDKNSQSLVQAEVFGERQILKASEFLQADFGKLSNSLSKVPTEQLDQAINKLAAFSDRSDLLTQNRELEDIINKSRVINSGMITQRDQLERVNLERENLRIKSYQDIAALSETTNRMAKQLDELVVGVGGFFKTFLPKFDSFLESLNKFQNKLAGGILKYFTKGD